MGQTELWNQWFGVERVFLLFYIKTKAKYSLIKVWHFSIGWCPISCQLKWQEREVCNGMLDAIPSLCSPLSSFFACLGFFSGFFFRFVEWVRFERMGSSEVILHTMSFLELRIFPKGMIPTLGWLFCCITL